MLNVVLFGVGKPVIDLARTLSNSAIKVLGIVLDTSNELDQESFNETLSSLHLSVLDIANIPKCDLILVMNYNRIISSEIINRNLVINIHMGILPIWRGNNANAWAILNGEKFVGYTIHKVSDVLDGGDIYYINKQPVDLDTSYQVAKNAMMKDLHSNIGTLLLKINNGSLKSFHQDESSIYYGVRLREKDGQLMDWDIPSIQFERLNYIFKKPLGTGLKFSFRGEELICNSVKEVKNYKNSFGVPGSIVKVDNDSIWVKAKDTAVRLAELTLNEKPIEPKLLFRAGMRL